MVAAVSTVRRRGDAGGGGQAGGDAASKHARAEEGHGDHDGPASAATISATADWFLPRAAAAPTTTRTIGDTEFGEAPATNGTSGTEPWVG